MKKETDGKWKSWKIYSLREKIISTLDSGNLPFFELRDSSREENAMRMDLVLYSRNHVILADKLLTETFGTAITGIRSEDENPSDRLTGYRYRVDFEDTPFILIVNTPLGLALSAYMGFFLEEDHGIRHEDLKELKNRTEELERYVSGMCDVTGGMEPKEERDFSDRAADNPPKYDENLINPSEVMLYLQLNPSILEKWVSIAGEMGMLICRNPVEAGTGRTAPRGLVPLVTLLRERGIRDFLDLKEYFHGNLENWEDLYRNFETARLNSLFRSKETTPFEFAWILLRAADLWNN